MSKTSNILRRITVLCVLAFYCLPLPGFLDTFSRMPWLQWVASFSFQQKGILLTLFVGATLLLFWRVCRRHPFPIPFVPFLFAVYFIPALATLIVENQSDFLARDNVLAVVLATTTGLFAVLILYSVKQCVQVLLFIMLAQACYTLLLYKQGEQMFLSGSMYRATGTFNSPNSLYTLALVALSFAFVLSFTALNRERLLALVTTSFALTVLLLTGSRGGTLAFVVGICFVAYHLFWKKRNFVLLACSIFLCFALFFVTLFQRTVGQTNIKSIERSNRGRLLLWKQGWDEFIKHPITGAGAGSVALSVVVEGNNPHNTITKTLNEPKNLILFYLCELGVSGGILFVVFATIISRCCRVIMMRTQSSSYALGLTTAWIVLLVAGLFDTPFGQASRGAGNCCFGFLFGLTILMYQECCGSPHQKEQREIKSDVSNDIIAA